jgi:glycosyltransferase involved in cell wall biosynthesis
VFVALDATYLVDPHPSGIAIYSRELLEGLARSHPGDQFLHFYRLKQYRRSMPAAFPNVRKRLLLPPIPSTAPWRQPDVFHALNQRVDSHPARHVISTFHDLFVMTGEYSSADFRARFTTQARHAAERSDLIITVSEFTRDQVVSCLNVDRERIRVVPHGVHLPDDPAPLDRRERFILCVGALQVRKNVIRLIQAFERLPARVVSGWKLVLAGSTAGFGAAEIVACTEQSSASSQIQLRGYVTAAELKDLYQRALIFAFPSLDEGFGIPVLEAMANGIPVLTSNRSALPQVVGDAAVLTDPYDLDGISHALGGLIENESLRAKLRVLGLERARLFPWERTVQATYAVYEELQNEKLIRA